MAKMITVYGSPNSGKTTLSVAMAHTLANAGYNVCVVCCDNLTPTIPTLLPQTVNKVNDLPTKIKSIGKVLTCIEFSTNDILMQSVYSKKFSKIILIGYAYGENELTYPEPTDYDVYSFYGKLSTMVDYIIVDCSNKLTGQLTRVAMEHADSIIRVVGASYKDISFFASNDSIVPEGEVKKDAYITVYPRKKKADTIEFLQSFYGNIDFEIKENPSISEMMNCGEYFIHSFPSEYIKEVKKILEEIDYQ